MNSENKQKRTLAERKQARNQLFATQAMERLKSREEILERMRKHPVTSGLVPFVDYKEPSFKYQPR